MAKSYQEPAAGSPQAAAATVVRLAREAARHARRAHGVDRRGEHTGRTECPRAFRILEKAARAENDLAWACTAVRASPEDHAAADRRFCATRGSGQRKAVDRYDALWREVGRHCDWTKR